MVGIVIVSHSAKVAEGIKDLANQMSHNSVKIMAAGGMEDGGIGTDAVKISNAIIEADSGDGVAVLADLGSAVLSTLTALELIDENLQKKVIIADAPILEGAITAVIQASVGSGIEEVVSVAESTRDMLKL